MPFVLKRLLLCQSQPLRADDSEKEARAVFVKMVNAARDGNDEEFKSCLVKEDLKEMEEQGFVELMMMMMAAMLPRRRRRLPWRTETSDR